MELHPGQTTGADRRHDLVQSCVHEHAVLLQLRGQPFRDLPNRVSFHLPGTWSKDKAYCMGAALSGKTRIFKA